MVLRMDAVDCFYGDVQVLRRFSLTTEAGETLCLLGRNGAGKTTALKAIMGIVRATAGTIELDGELISQLPPHEVPKRGIGYVPQGRRLFAELTVKDNLDIGMMARRSGADVMEQTLALFPLLKERFHQRAGTLSGGEQQMLAIARALCLDPKLLLLDEPTEGLMPSMIERIREVVVTLKRRGVTTILVEQRVDAVLPVATRVAFVDGGRVVDLVPVGQLAADRSLVDRHVGVGL